MQVVKNFGFTRPFIKTEQAGDYIHFADEFESATPARSARSMAARRSQAHTRIPHSALKLDAFRDWCQSMKDTWEGDIEPVDGPHFRRWRRFTEARKFARSLGLKSGAEWRKFSKGVLTELGMRPDDIPGCPERIYREEGWAGYRDWLGIV